MCSNNIHKLQKIVIGNDLSELAFGKASVFVDLLICWNRIANEAARVDELYLDIFSTTSAI